MSGPPFAIDTRDLQSPGPSKRALEFSPTNLSPPLQKAKMQSANGQEKMDSDKPPQPLTTSNLPHALISALSDPGVMAAMGTIMQNALSKKLESFQSQLDAKDSRIDQLEGELNSCRSELATAKNALGNLEQYSRRETLRIQTDVEETDDENTDQIVLNLAGELGAHLTEADISRSHRVGPKTPKKIRPIIVKFATYRARDKLFNVRKNASGTFISEELTKQRNDLFFKARQERNNGTFKHVWCKDGNIKIRFHDGKVYTANFIKDLDELVDKAKE